MSLDRHQGATKSHNVCLCVGIKAHQKDTPQRLWIGIKAHQKDTPQRVSTVVMIYDYH
jgi:hypothetical protein